MLEVSSSKAFEVDCPQETWRSSPSGESSHQRSASAFHRSGSSASSLNYLSGGSLHQPPRSAYASSGRQTHTHTHTNTHTPCDSHTSHTSHTSQTSAHPQHVYGRTQHAQAYSLVHTGSAQKGSSRQTPDLGSRTNSASSLTNLRSGSAGTAVGQVSRSQSWSRLLRDQSSIAADESAAADGSAPAHSISYTLSHTETGRSSYRESGLSRQTSLAGSKDPAVCRLSKDHRQGREAGPPEALKLHFASNRSLFQMSQKKTEPGSQPQNQSQEIKEREGGKPAETQRRFQDRIDHANVTEERTIGGKKGGSHDHSNEDADADATEAKARKGAEARIALQIENAWKSQASANQHLQELIVRQMLLIRTCASLTIQRMWRGHKTRKFVVECRRTPTIFYKSQNPHSSVFVSQS